MKSHLSQEAMLRWQASEASEVERAHVAECPECRAQTQPLADALHWFGAAAREWGAEKAALARTSRVDIRATLHWGRFAAGLAVACMLLVATGIALLRWQQSPSVPMQARVQQQQETAQQELARDNTLLEEVDQDVSQEVPSAMQPLSWSASDTTARQ